MNFLSKIFQGNKENQIQKKISKLKELEASLNSLENEKSEMEKKNPLIGSIGIMMGIGTPPPGFQSTVQAAETRYSNLNKKISTAKKAIGDITGKLKTLNEEVKGEK